MDDGERAKVGTCYKKHGQEAAIKLGHKLVSGVNRDEKMALWKHYIKENPKGYSYCFRGGLRSKTVQKWLAEEAINYPIIEGGYKAIRRFLIDKLDELTDSFTINVIGGRTGTLKTDLINELDNSIDLEGRANHRGSSFGRRVGGQPTVINFENQIAIDLLKLKKKYSSIFIEDEGVTIGSCSVPEPLRKKMKLAPMYIVEASVNQRVDNILRDYVLHLSEEYRAADPENGYENYKQSMFASLSRIKKRLGGARYNHLHKLMSKALDANENKSSIKNYHRDWIEYLLVEYYDPMYDYQLEKKQSRIVERGSWKAIKDICIGLS